MSFSSDIMFMLVALIAGIAMAVQGTMNSAVSRAVGLSEATFLVHISATIAMAVILFLGLGEGRWQNYNKVPWYYYLGGLIGVVITYGVVVSISKLGAAVATTAIIAGQVLTACLADHFGLFGLEKAAFTWTKFLGLVLLAIGSRLLLNKI